MPRIIAAIYLMQYYHYHNLTPTSMDKDLIQTISISDGKKHNLHTLSADLNVD